MRWLLSTLMVVVLTGCSSGESRDAPARSGAADHPDATAVVASLKARGLPITDTQTLTADTDSNHLLGRPGQYTAKAVFRDGRIPADGGSVETFATEDDAKRRATYVDGITQTPLFAEYHWRRGRVFLRVSHDLTPDQADAYARALAEVVKE